MNDDFFLWYPSSGNDDEDEDDDDHRGRPTEHFLAIPRSWVQKRARSNLVSLMDFP
jgi:hypothetical protein